MTPQNSSDAKPPASASLKERIHEAYESGAIYKVETICRTPDGTKKEYVDRLLEDKLSTIRRHAQEGPMLYLCLRHG